MALRLGDEAPNFTAETTEGTINFHEWLGNGVGHSVFSSERFYAGLHDRTGNHGQDHSRVQETEM